MNRKQTIVTTLLSLLIIALVLLISGRLWMRFDLTENKSWTISPVSRNIADEITDNVTITYFVTDKLKKLLPFPGDIEDLIGEYVSFSRGKITFIEIDPAKDGLDQKMAQLGIQPQEIQVTEKDQISALNVYSGILIEYQDKQEVMPLVYKTDTLEYEITNRIRGMIRESDKDIGVISGERNAFNEDGGFSLLHRFLSQAGYKPRDISINEEIPDTLAALFVIGGADVFDDTVLYRIDRYIQCGGKVFFALKSVSISTYGAYLAEKINDKGLLEMVSSYGVRVEPALVLDKSSSMMGFRSGQGGMQLIQYPFYVHVRQENADRKSQMTSEFPGVDLYWPNSLELNIPENIEAVTLFTTTDSAWLQKDNFTIDPQMASVFLSNADEVERKIPLAVSLSGKFPSFWRDKPKPEGDNIPDMPSETLESRLIVIGNTDFLAGNINFLSYQYAPYQTNLDFAVMAAGWLGNDDDIISIRARTPSSGTFDKIFDEKERAAAFSFVRLLNTIFAPLIVFAAGILFAMRRKKAAARLQGASKEDTDAL
ncbi:MAG: GldG family protein [Spirochaetaceae bacterium]|jgi:gliding-associated putative ABC transporter substrate-binding component GldG|nr:GldG family protein [Spirochaetaceae bacterium]